MAQLVEVALEEESAIRSERFKRNFPEKGQQNNQGNRHMSQKRFEQREVRVATVTCYRCRKTGHIARNCKEFPGNDRDEQIAKGPVNSRNRSGNEQRTAYRSNRR
jgi:ssDNA-binding Zn-finger/Zn-ribbon topoisomerase 1